jgi:small multidrug resistance pump
MNLSYAYIFLGIAIVLEITGTSFVKDTEGFTRWIPTIICLVAICFSYYLMSHVVSYIPIGITYATWSGLGIAAITIIGIFKYKQVPNLATIIGLSLIIIGVVIVNLMNDIKVDN